MFPQKMRLTATGQLYLTSDFSDPSDPRGLGDVRTRSLFAIDGKMTKGQDHLMIVLDPARPIGLA
jgi:hypothetical protein